MRRSRLIIETLEAAVNLIEKASACGAGAPGAPGFSPNNTCNRFSGGSSKPAAGGESAGSENQKVRLSSEMIPLEKEKHLKSVAGDLKKAGLSGRMVKKGEKRYLQLSTTGMSGGMIASSVAERLAEKAEWVKDSSSVSPGADSDVAVLSKNGLSIKVSSHGEKPTTIAILKMTETGKKEEVSSKPSAGSPAISKPKPAEGGGSKPPKPLKSLNSKQKKTVFDHLDRLFHSPNELDWNRKSVLVPQIAMKFNLTKPLASRTFDEWGATDPQSRAGKYQKESYPKSSAWISEPVNLSDVE